MYKELADLPPDVIENILNSLKDKNRVRFAIAAPAVLKGLSRKERLKNLHVADKYGDTPLHVAAKKGDVNVIKELLKGLLPVDRVKLLHRTKERKAYIHTDYDGCTPLRIAAHNGHSQVVRVLEE